MHDLIIKYYLQHYVIIILCFSVVGQGISSVGPLYEEVDSMILNPRYLTHKLHTTEVTHTYLLPQSGLLAQLVFLTHSRMCVEAAQPVRLLGSIRTLSVEGLLPR